MDPKKVIMTKRIEANLDLYAMFYDHAWAESLVRKVSSTPLESAFENLCISWKEASNTHRLPWLMITQMAAFVDGYTRDHRPMGMRLVDLLKLRLTRELGDSLRNMQKRKIDDALESISCELIAANTEVDVSIEPYSYWNAILAQSEFQSSIWGSQSLSYCALIFAYEWFVVSCFRLLGGDEERPNGKKFWSRFNLLLGDDPKAKHWDDRAVKIAREARNSVAHLGGKAKQELLDEHPALFISKEGDITIQPSDTRDLYVVLKGKVEQLVDEVLPKTASVPKASS